MMFAKKHTAPAEPKNKCDVYYDTYYNKPIDDGLVYLESRDGMDFTGNIFRIAQELCTNPAYAHLRMCVRVRDGVQAKVEALCARYGLDRSRFEFAGTEWQAIEVMERARFLVTDSGMPWAYIKREGQVVLNTWHGTPLKVMGKFTPTEEHTVGGVQHVFLSSDYALFPSDYMREKMLRSYMVDKVASGRAMMEGYPRNSVFFDAQGRGRVREELGFGDKTVYAYMPTHRGNRVQSKNSSQLIDVLDYLCELDCYLNDSELLLVKLHVFNQSQIDFRQFDHIVAFPEGYEPYDVLNATDCLITDYSSVMFDYANTRNNIILFTYDEEEYFQDRGTYFPLSELPFPSVKTVGDLLGAMRAGKTYDDAEFLGRFCTYDNATAVDRICRQVFLGQDCCTTRPIANGKENVLVFAGSLAKNGITTALMNMLKSVDKSEKNYILAFKRQEVNSDPARVKAIPSDIDYIPLFSDQYYTTDERAAYDAFRAEKEDWDVEYPDLLKRLFKREWDRYYWGIHFSDVIQFDGYGINVNLLFLAADARRSVIVHNDMLKEMREKGNQHGPTLRLVYSSFEHVGVVSDRLVGTVEEISGRSDNVLVVNNIHDAQGVRERAQMPIELQKDTLVRCWTPGSIADFVSNEGYKFITIGRFSPEKGHMRLISAFDRFCDLHPTAKLMIVGGHGKLYDETLKFVLKQRHYEQIVVVRSLMNPMPILAKSDLFVLPSLYEGLPMVIQEADCLGIPVLSTDIEGPRGFMGQYGGYLCPDSEEGIYEGLLAFTRGEVKPMHVDYAARNELAMSQFNRLFGE